MPPTIVIKIINTYSCDGSGWGEGGSSCGIEERQSVLETYADSLCVDTSRLLDDASEFFASEMQTEPSFFQIELTYWNGLFWRFLLFLVGPVAHSVYQLTTGWTIRDGIPVGTRFSAPSDRPWGPPSLLYKGYGVFPDGRGGRGVGLTPPPPSSAEGPKKG